MSWSAGKEDWEDRVCAFGGSCCQMRRKNIFGTKKIPFGENKWRKKFSFQNITDLGCFMSLNRQ